MRANNGSDRRNDWRFELAAVACVIVGWLLLNGIGNVLASLLTPAAP